VQEQSQHQPKDNFLEEHITYQVCLKLFTQVKVTIVYPSSRNVAIPTLYAIPIGITAKTFRPSSK
jgi:hypothetical protein